MARKTLALIVLAAFCLFELSCVSTVGMAPFQINPNKANYSIVGVVTKAGESYEFRASNPARLVPREKAVTGSVLQDGEIAKTDIQSAVRDAKGAYVSILAADGRRLSIVSAEERGETEAFKAYAPVTIPLSDIQQVWVRKTSGGKVLLVAVLTVAALGVLSIFAMANAIEDTFEKSCPFVYSWNGEEYILDAEPYGAAVSEGLKRTDWAELTSLREVDGACRLLLTNELDETQYTDELKLVAVDHAPGVKVAPDLSGRVHAFGGPLPPVSAVDRTGRDVLVFVRDNDRAFWMSDLESRDPDEPGDFRDELAFEFPKLAGAGKAKLLANVWTTQWGSASAGLFMELFGSSLDETYAEIDRRGPMYGRVLSWMAAEELYNLKVWVETPGGWKARGMIMGGAPVVTKDKACVLDVADVPGEVLRVKLRPPVNFWMVNSLAVDYGEDSPVQVTELAATDGSYLVSPNPGDRAELEFAAPSLGEGLERTVLVKASGYYKVHLEASGEPRTELVEHVLGEPGFAARYSFREYRKWAEGLAAGQSNAKR